MPHHFSRSLFPLMLNHQNLSVALPSEKSSPIAIRDEQQLVFCLGIKPFPAFQLTENFLHNQGIIPHNWPIKTLLNTPDLVKLSWQEYLIIIAQANQLFFQENLDPQSLNPSVAARIAHQFVEKVTNVNYQSIQLMIQRTFSINKSATFGTNYLQNTLLSPGVVEKVNNNWIGGEINYRYQLPQGQFYFNVKAHQQPQFPFLVFIGKFNYTLIQFPAQAKQNQIKSLLNNWQQDYQIFINLINNRFLY